MKNGRVDWAIMWKEDTVSCSPMVLYKPCITNRMTHRVIVQSCKQQNQVSSNKKRKQVGIQWKAHTDISPIFPPPIYKQYCLTTLPLNYIYCRSEEWCSKLLFCNRFYKQPVILFSSWFYRNAQMFYSFWREKKNCIPSYPI